MTNFTNMNLAAPQSFKFWKSNPSCHHYVQYHNRKKKTNALLYTRNNSRADIILKDKLKFKIIKAIFKRWNKYVTLLPTCKGWMSTAMIFDWFDFWYFNATFSSIWAISCRSVLVVEEAGVPGENHRPLASNW